MSFYLCFYKLSFSTLLIVQNKRNINNKADVIELYTLRIISMPIEAAITFNNAIDAKIISFVLILNDLHTDFSMDICKMNKMRKIIV